MHDQPPRWKTAVKCSPSQCVEVSDRGTVRDTKNPDANAIITADFGQFLTAVKKGRFTTPPRP